MNGAPIEDRKTWFLLLSWGLLLVLFLWTLRSILQPLVLFLVLIYLLSPLYGTRVYGRIVVALGFLTAIWLVWSVGWILTPFVLALVLAFILNPLVSRVERDGLSRTGATVLVFLTFLVVLILTVAILGPVVSGQVANFVSKLPELLDAAITWLRTLLDKISHIPIPGIGRMELGDVLKIDTSNLGSFIASKQQEIRESLLSGARGLGKGLGIALTVLSYLLVTPIVTFFLLRDYDKIVHGVERLVPEGRRPATAAFVREYDVLLGKWLRSQLLVMVMVGVIVGVGFWIVGFPYAALLGVLAGVFNIVPYLGMILTVIPAVLIALVSGSVGIGLLKVVGVFGVEQLIENIVSPRIVGQSVGLHPVWVMLSIVLFSYFFGPVGLLIAVPAAVGIKMMLSNVFHAYRASTYYRETPIVTPAGLGETLPGDSAVAGPATGGRPT